MIISPARMFLASRFTWGMLFAMMATVSMIYQIEVAGLSALQLVLVGTALEVSAFLFEVPTGVLADRYSRKFSVVIGFVITGASFVLAASFPIFWVIAAASFIWGIGWTFISGAHQAWIADEVGELAAAELYLKGQQLVAWGSFVGIAIAAALGSINIAWPYLLSGILFVLWGGVAFVGMQETWTPGSGSADRSANPIDTTTGLGAALITIRASPILLLLLTVGFFEGTFSEGYDRLSQAHLLRNFEFPAPWGLAPVVVFGALYALGNLGSIIAVGYIRRNASTRTATGMGTILALTSVAIALSTLIFALSNSVVLALMLYTLLQPLRAIGSPLVTAWLNQHSGSANRATILSLHGQADAFGQMAGGPGVGFIAEHYGIKVGIAIASTLLLPAVWLYRKGGVKRVFEKG